MILVRPLEGRATGARAVRVATSLDGERKMGTESITRL